MKKRHYTVQASTTILLCEFYLCRIFMGTSNSRSRSVGRGGARGAHAPPPPPRSQNGPPDEIVKDLK